MLWNCPYWTQQCYFLKTHLLRITTDNILQVSWDHIHFPCKNRHLEQPAEMWWEFTRDEPLQPGDRFADGNSVFVLESGHVQNETLDCLDGVAVAWVDADNGGLRPAIDIGLVHLLTNSSHSLCIFWSKQSTKAWMFQGKNSFSNGFKYCCSACSGTLKTSIKFQAISFWSLVSCCLLEWKVLENWVSDWKHLYIFQLSSTLGLL